MQFAAVFMAGVQAVGALVSGAEERNQLQYSAQVNERNAIYKQQNATLENQLATADANLQRRRGREATAEMSASLAQSGFLVNGDAARAIQASGSEAEMDALSIQYRGLLRARGEQIEAEGLRAQAKADRAAAKAVPAKTLIKAATSALSGYSQMRGMRIA